MKPVTTGDARLMATKDLQDKLQQCVSAWSHVKGIYYILVVIKNHYQGPAPFKNAETGESVETTDKLLPDKLVHTRIIGPMRRPPLIRQLGSMLWAVSNRTGTMRLVYALPMDVPTALEDSDNAGEIVPAVASAAQGIPLAYGG